MNERWNFNNSYQQLSKKMYSVVQPTKVSAPEMVLYNKQLAKELGLDFEPGDSQLRADIFSGNAIPPNAFPIAQAYAGHQFGHFNILGDGRAILLGELITPQKMRVDMQLKGSGPTQYSRRGDGRATLRSMLREYLISEAMHGLGISSTRSLAVVTTGELVHREEMQEGAVLTRIAASHIRVGTFEYARNFLSVEEMGFFLKYVIKRHYPQLESSFNPALEFLRSVLIKQVALMVDWMRVGFIHGVMNTDNMSIAGETIDYGPCAFMNSYHAQKVFSSIDANGRYAYDNQPKIALWNLSCLAGSLLPLIHANELEAIKMAEDILNEFPVLYQQQYATMMAKKIGFPFYFDGVAELTEELLQWMQLNKADFTNSFLVIQAGKEALEGIYAQEAFKIWMLKRENILTENGVAKETSIAIMQLNNPIFIPRNHLVEQALDSVCIGHNYGYFNEFLSILQKPYTANELWSSCQEPPVGGDANYITYCGT